MWLRIYPRNPSQRWRPQAGQQNCQRIFPTSLDAFLAVLNQFSYAGKSVCKHFDLSAGPRRAPFCKNTQAADGLNKAIAPCKQMAMLGVYWTLPKHCNIGFFLSFALMLYLSTDTHQSFRTCTKMNCNIGIMKINMVSFIKVNGLFAHYYTLPKATPPPGSYFRRNCFQATPLPSTKCDRHVGSRIWFTLRNHQVKW